MTEGSAQVNFTCPTKLLKEFDEIWKKTWRIPSRKDALLRAMEDFITAHKEAD